MNVNLGTPYKFSILGVGFALQPPARVLGDLQDFGCKLLRTYILSVSSLLYGKVASLVQK